MILVLLFLGIQTAGAETYMVRGLANGDVLNIRETPSYQSKIISFVPPYGKGIEKLARCTNGWCKISYRGMTGWSSSKFLAPESSVRSSNNLVREPSVKLSYRVKGVHSDDVLYIRVKPSTKSRKVGSIPPNGRGINKLGACKGNRCKISYRGITGWTSMRYLVAEKPSQGSLKRSIVNKKPAKAIQRQVKATQKPPMQNKKPLYQNVPIALTSTTTIRQNGIKSNPYKLQGKTYFIEARGTVKYKTDPKLTDNPGIYGVDACYLFSFTPSAIKNPPVAIKLLKNSGNNDVCANARYNPKHIYRSKPFDSNNSYQFWIDNSAYRALPIGRGFLTVNIYETRRQ